MLISRFDSKISNYPLRLTFGPSFSLVFTLFRGTYCCGAGESNIAARDFKKSADKLYDGRSLVPAEGGRTTPKNENCC